MYSTYKTAYQPAQYNVSNLNYGANNQYKGFPPKMSDSRSLVSSSQPVSVTDFYLKNNTNTNNSNWVYREYLKNNASDIQRDMQRKSLNDVGYYQRFIQNINNEALTATPIIPYLYSSIFDNSKPFGHQDSDVKQIYLTREQLNARLMTPKIQA
jgi:hypothetical protein